MLDVFERVHDVYKSTHQWNLIVANLFLHHFKLQDHARAAGVSVLQPWTAERSDGGPREWCGAIRRSLKAEDNIAEEGAPPPTTIGEGMRMALQSAWLLCAQSLQALGPSEAPDPRRQRHTGVTDPLSVSVLGRGARPALLFTGSAPQPAHLAARRLTANTYTP